MRCATRIGTPVALALATAIQCADSGNFLSKELFNGTLDFELVRIAIHLEHIFIVFLLQEGGFLTDENSVEDLVNIFHDYVCELDGLCSAPSQCFVGIFNDDDGVSEKELLNVHF